MMKQLALKQARVEWVDVARGIGIIAVVYGHAVRGIQNSGIAVPQSFHLWSDSLVYSFHMPLFFILSGMFFLTSLDKQALGTFLSQKLRLLAYPYLLWSLIQGGAEMLFNQHTNGTFQSINPLQLLWEPFAHFWFLHNLLIILVISAAVVTLLPRSKWALSIVAILLFVSPWRYPSVNYFFAFFVTGTLVSPFLFKTNWEKVNAGRWFVVSLAAWFVGASMMILNDISLGALPIVTALLGVAAVILGSIRLSKGYVPNVLVLFGRNSLFIYLAHVLAAAGIRILLVQLGFTNVILHIVAGTVGGLILPLLLYRLTVTSGSSSLLVPPRFFKVKAPGQTVSS